MKNNESEEMYLETILRLKQHSSYVRAIDVANELGFSRPSVSNAMALLKSKKYIEIDGWGGDIRFTKEGKKRAEMVYDRHKVLTDLLVRAGVPEDIAEENACRVEHVLSEECFKYLKNIDKNC